MDPGGLIDPHVHNRRQRQPAIVAFTSVLAGAEGTEVHHDLTGRDG
jgi:hypothetical protein